MADEPPPGVPARPSPVVWGVILGIVSVAIPAAKFGRPFLLQFLVSPFQFFIAPLWLLAFFSVRSGVMPMRSGPSVRRDEDPARFWMNVRCCVLFGAVMFAFNLAISWLVVSRRR